MTATAHGRLASPNTAPRNGERVEEVARASRFVVEQISSGELDAPVDYLQTHDEWVVVLAGGATLEVRGESLELAAGDWVLLPAGVPHRLVRTERGTSWLAVSSTASPA
jgi:mannose-6-phosphate isomerase-like protein (cupin superfamily)